jgi:cytochrome c-type biogenesis protein
MPVENVNLFAAFAAGILAFISPCILPLVPIYIGYLSGSAVSETTPSRWVTFGHALAFVLGFSLIFTALGAAVGLLGGLLTTHMPLLRRASGLLLIVLGLSVAGVLKIPFLSQERQIQWQPSSPSYPASFLVGLIFALGWTPCIGPILGAILVLAGTSETVAQGAFLLAIFSLGLGVPFLLVGLALGQMRGLLRRINRYGNVIYLVSGGFLILMGLLLLTDILFRLNSLLQNLWTPPL